MAAASVDAPLGEEDKIKIIAEAYRPFLIDVLDVRDIVESLKIQFDGDDVRFTHVLELIEKGETRSRLTECFLDALAEKKDHQGLYRAVIDALFYSGNERIADHIEGTSQFDTKRWEQYRSFLKLYASRLEDIEPLLLLGSLNEHLNPRDLETIRKKVQNEGNRAGASELLLRLDRKSEDCFKAFIKALEENGFRFLARDMEEMTSFALGISADDEEANDDHEDNDEEIPEGDNMSDGEVKKLTLRSYQEEVLTPALKGQNAMVVLPTGKGKTEVAIALISRRFLSRDAVAGAGATSHRRQKCIFVVNKVPLVKQQKDRCLKYLKGTCRVAGTSGEDLNNVPLNTIIDDNEITVLTAQVLVNALKDENIKLSDIALLVLDECHHCQKSNPYNVLMAMYRDLKLNSPRLPRPQILGLTASPGVGDSKNLVQAQEYITKLCANLDCRISRPKIYAHQLNKGKSPEEIFLIVKGRSSEDRYFREIGVIMKRIEDNIKVLEAGRKLVEETDIFSKVASCRGTQSYEQGVINLRKSIQQRVENGDDRRELMTCVSYLREYNNSLFINRDARTSDAISYMEDYIDEEERSNPSGPADIRLKNMFRDKLEVLNRIANLHDNINPVLNELGKQLKKEYGKKEESLSIIFTRTRESAKALVKWLNEDPDLKHLNAKILIGGGSQGMTSAEQNRNLHLFATKTCRVLVATSIAEEGLDIKKCNMIFRYNYVTSDIGHIQTKGRSRADFDGKVFIIVNSDLQLQDRELKNIIRVKMMNEVVEGIAESTLKNGKKFDDRILMEQKKDQKDRQREKENARIKAKKEEKPGILLYCNWCHREACSLDDVKCIHNQHHVVINDLFLSKMTLVELKRQPLVDEMKFQKKVHCSDCRHKWGKLVMYRQQKFPLIDISNFELKDGNGRKWFPAAWKDVPFVIQSIDLEDLGRQSSLSAQTCAQEEGLHQENEEEEEDGVFLEYSNIMQIDE